MHRPQIVLIRVRVISAGSADSALVNIDMICAGTQPDRWQRFRRCCKAVCCKLEVTGDFLREVADTVCHRRAEAGMKFPVCAKPACCSGRLEHEHALATPCQIRSADQAVVSRSNDD